VFDDGEDDRGKVAEPVLAMTDHLLVHRKDELVWEIVVGRLTHVGNVDHFVSGRADSKVPIVLDGRVHQILRKKHDLSIANDLQSSVGSPAVHARSAPDFEIQEVPVATGVVSRASHRVEPRYPRMHATSIVLKVVDCLVVETAVDAPVDPVHRLQEVRVTVDQLSQCAYLFEGDHVVLWIDDWSREALDACELMTRLLILILLLFYWSPSFGSSFLSPRKSRIC